LILDLVPAHTQTDFNKKSGSARINASNTDAAELMMVHVLESCNYAFIEGWDNINLLKKVIHKLKLISIFLTDEVISGLIDDYQSPRARYDLEESLPIILLLDRETKKNTIIVTCMQISAAIGGPDSSNRMSGKIYTPIIHQTVCFFCLDADRGGRESGTGEPKNLNGLIFESAEMQRIKRPQYPVSRLATSQYFDKLFIRMELPRSRRIFVFMACCQSQLNSCHQARPEVLVVEEERLPLASVRVDLSQLNSKLRHIRN
jgi:hypothetical protein